MRWYYFIVLQVIILLIVGATVYQHKNKVSLVKNPPTELSQWYKPNNKRQVWLHNMFKLRREMQAVAFYSKQQDSEHLTQWTKQLKKHYLKIADMVPSWQKKLDMQAMLALSSASTAQDYLQFTSHLKTLQQSCDSCHDDYQAITALTYRSADFSSIEVSDNISFDEHMNTLSQQVNLIKISAQDGFTEQALLSLSELKLSMDTLGESCITCHKKDRKNYPSELMIKTQISLKDALVSGSAKDKGKELGTLAVLACARCHGTHKIAYGVKKHLSKNVGFSELIKH